MPTDTTFTSLNDVEPFLRVAWEKYCIDGEQCKCPTCPVNTLMLNMDIHLKYKVVFLIFGDLLVLEGLGSHEGKSILRKN